MSKQLDSILKLAPRATVEHDKSPAVKAKASAKKKSENERAMPAPKHKERDVSLGADVPESVKRAVSIMAATEGVTNRTIILRALQSIGIAVPNDELRDRRK